MKKARLGLAAIDTLLLAYMFLLALGFAVFGGLSITERLGSLLMMGVLAVMAALGITAVVGWARRVARAAAAARLAVAAPLALLLLSGSLVAPVWLLLSSIAFLAVAVMRRDYGTVPARWPAWLPQPPAGESGAC